MELSTFEKSVITALIKGDSESELISEQLKDATVKKRDYTGVGLYTDLQINENAPRLNKTSRFIEEVPKAHLDHPELSAGAGAMLWITDGLISTLECYAYDEQWPKDESKFTICV